MIARILFALSLWACTAGAAPIGRIWLSHASTGPDKIVVNWETELPGDSAVEFGATENLGRRVAKEEAVTLHHVEIPLLPHDGLHHYQVRSGDDMSAVAAFKGYGGDTLRVVIVGDWGYSKAEDLSAITKDDPHLLISAGDNVASLHGKGREGTKAFSA